MVDKQNSSASRDWVANLADEDLQEGDRVMHPVHGVGRVVRIAVEDVSGFSLELVHTVFDRTDLTLRVPTSKVRSIGLRRIASRSIIDEALAAVQGKAKLSKVTWSRRAQDYQAKINSGDPRIVAEAIRDLARNAVSGEQSFSERLLYEEALDRLACEIAAVEGVGHKAAAAKITAQIGSSAR